MVRISNPQSALKPQDLFVVIKVAIRGRSAYTYAALGKELFMSASEIHGSLARAKLSMLLIPGDDERMDVARASLREFLLHGARYAFPPILGALTRGLPTAYGAPALRDQISQSDDPVPVWPYPKGSVRGMALQPLYPSVPRAAEVDPQLYDVLAMFDAIRIGAAREREIATSFLNRVLS